MTIHEAPREFTLIKNMKGTSVIKRCHTLWGEHSKSHHSKKQTFPYHGLPIALRLRTTIY